MFNIDTRLKKVDSHLQNGDDNQAISILENIFVKYPKNIRIIEKLKQVSYNKGLCKFREDPKLLGEVNHVLALIEEKQFQLAYNESRKILEDDSNNAIILKVAAKADYEIGNLDQSIDFYSKSLKINPYDLETLGNIALAYSKVGKNKEALEFYNRGISLNPESYFIYNNLGTLYYDLGQYELSIKNFLKAIKINPNNSDVYQNLGISYRDSNLIEPAKKSFFKSIELDDQNLNAYNNLGILYRNIGDYHNALLIYEKAINLNPNFSDLCLNYGTILSEVGEHEKGISWLQKCLEIEPNSEVAISNLLLISNYVFFHSSSKLFYFHKKYGSDISSINVIPNNESQTNEDRNFTKSGRIKLGYISGDFHNHSVSYFFKPLLNSLDKNKFEIFCYYNAFINDKVTKELKHSSENWRDVASLTDKQLYSLIKSDSIDLLIDLSGHTHKNRLSVFAMKPAHKQATWLGYPNTTGIDNIDYRIVDIYTDLAENDKFNIEKLYKLETPFLCFEGDENIEIEDKSPVLENTYITFGSFNNLSKLSDPLIGLWCKILLKVPNSKLILKNKQLNSDFMKTFYYEKFSKFGISKERLELIGWINSKHSHLEAYNKIDIALDTYPYHGTTTTFEALWMGVPVISLIGEKHSSRVGYSILKNLQLDNLLVKNEENYINKAIELSKNIEILLSYKKDLRNLLKNSILCNKTLHGKNMEKCYLNILSS